VQRVQDQPESACLHPDQKERSLIWASAMKYSDTSIRLRPAALLMLLLFSVLILTSIYYWVFAEFPCNSDCAGAFLAATDMKSGNWRLKGWWWGSDPLWTSDLAFEAGLIALLGNHPSIMMLTSAFDWAGVVVLSAMATGAGVSRSRLALLPVAVIIALPVLRHNSPMNLITLAPMHIGSLLYILAMFLLVPIASTAGRVAVPALIALDVVTVLAVAGDPLALVVGVGSVSVVLALAAAKQKDRWKALVLVNIVGAALLGKYVMVWNQAHGGLRLEPTPLTFVSFEDLPRNISLALKSFLVLTGSDFFGKDLRSAILYLVRFPFLLAMGWVLCVVTRRFARYVRGTHGTPEPDLLDQILLVAAAINILTGIMSSMLVNIDAARYFIPSVIFLAILTGRNLPAIRPLKIYGCLALSATILLLGYDYAMARPTPTLLPPDKKALADLLVQHHLTDGYASYWSASLVTVATRGAVRVRNVAVCADRAGCGDAVGKVVPVYLIAKEAWYSGFGRRDRPFFVVIDKLNVPQAVPQGAVTATFGTPSRRYDLPEYAIEVFDPVAP
jgi:hypothetical protein